MSFSLMVLRRNTNSTYVSSRIWRNKKTQQICIGNTLFNIHLEGNTSGNDAYWTDDPSLVVPLSRHPRCARISFEPCDMPIPFSSDMPSGTWTQNRHGDMTSFFKRCETEHALQPLDDRSIVEIQLPYTHDLRAANSARVSFGRRVTEFRSCAEDAELRKKYPDRKFRNPEENLLNFLAAEKHWTPFAHNQFLVDITDAQHDFPLYDMFETQHNRGWYARDITNDRLLMRQSFYTFAEHKCITPYVQECLPYSSSAYGGRVVDSDNSMTYLTPILNGEQSFEDAGYDIHPYDQGQLLTVSFRMRMPISIARQWYKHHMLRSEISGRYVSFERMPYVPATLRQGSADIKQGSLLDAVSSHDDALKKYMDSINASYDAYDTLGSYGVCNEQRRMVLPAAHYIEFIETGTIGDYANAVRLRLGKGAQAEIQQYAEAIDTLMHRSHFSELWKTLSRMQ